MDGFNIEYYDPDFGDFFRLTQFSQLKARTKLKLVPKDHVLTYHECLELCRKLDTQAREQRLIIEEYRKNDQTALIEEYRKNDIFNQGAKLKSRCWNPFLQLKIPWNKPQERLFSDCRIPALEQPVRDYFYASVDKKIQISRIEFIQNICLQKKFESTLIIMSKQGHEQPGTSPLSARFTDTPEKQAVLERFSKHYLRVSPNDKIKVVQTWAGVSPSTVELLCSVGFSDVRLIDKGYFGAGIYSTLQADYARSYAEGRFFGANPIPPNRDGEHCLLLCWVAVGNVYPISRDLDYDNYSPFSNFFHRHNGLALKPGFDSHCACVLLDETKFYQAAKYHLEKKQFDHDPKLLVDEIVVKESAQILPYCIVYYTNASAQEAVIPKANDGPIPSSKGKDEAVPAASNHLNVSLTQEQKKMLDTAWNNPT